MQKKLLTVAVAGALALPAVALAQVTVFGTIDGSIRNQSKVNMGAGATGAVLTENSGLRTTDRIGFRGSEDLGGGLMANFWMESAHASDTGATTLNTARKSVVGLSSGGNSVDLGRDYTVNFKSQGIYDPMSYTYTGVTPTATTNVAGTRSSNMVTAGFRFGTGGVRVDYALGEVVDESWGTRIGAMADFAFGPVTVTGAYSTEKDAATGTLSKDTMNFGGAYRMGAFTFRAGWSNTEQEVAGGTKNETPLLVLGAQYAISPTLNGRVGYYDLKNEVAGTETGKSKLVIIALDYSLSKRTTAYVEFDRRTLDGTFNSGAVGTLADGATAIGAGIAHSF